LVTGGSKENGEKISSAGEFKRSLEAMEGENTLLTERALGSWGENILAERNLFAKGIKLGKRA